MAQIFASDRSKTVGAPRVSCSKNSPATVQDSALIRLQASADQSLATTRLMQMRSWQDGMLQRREAEEEDLQMKPIQRATLEDEEPLQGKASNAEPQEVSTEPSASGSIPAPLQYGVHQLSGTDISDVKVHYNSAQPAQVDAHAFAQGKDIHVAAGQEKHLAHEAWHVVQQAQGRVTPTTQVRGAPVNNDPALEQEADVMGARAQALGAGFKAV